MSVDAYSMADLPPKFRARIVPDSAGCWIWTGALGPDGYGSSRRIGQVGTTTAHRVVYEFLRGDIPTGMDLDHVCFVRSCVNPGHLQAMDHASNVRRSKDRLRPTHCPQGHEYTPENLLEYRTDRGWAERRCRECRRVRRRAA